MSVEGLTLSGGTRIHRAAWSEERAMPLVTVITAALNAAGTIKGCIESVLRQDYLNLEHIVLDGGSSDGTLEVLRQYDDRIALWKSEPDRGIYDAWNKGLREARGEWICFLGADDEFLPGAVSAYMALAAKSPEAEYLSSRVKLVNSSGYERIFGGPWTWRRFAKLMCTAHPGSMHRRTLFDRLGGYDPSYRIVGDYELLLRAGRRLNSAYMPVTTVAMRDGGASCSLKALEESARAKVETGGRSKLLVAMERQIAQAKFVLRPLRYGWGRTMAGAKSRRSNKAKTSRSPS